MNKNIGFIGCGKMGAAMLEGMLKAGAVRSDQVKISTRSTDTLDKMVSQYKVSGTLDNREIAAFSDILFLAIQPSMHGQVLAEVKEFVKGEAIILTMAAGITTKQIEGGLGKIMKVVRTMPNTPSLVGEGMTAVSINQAVQSDDLALVEELLSSFGKMEVVPEHLMDAVPAISGSSPAYAYLFIEALADGGVRDGIPRSQAYRMAAQAVLGAAKMVLETEKHPGALKDDVCTPGGSTIAAVASLEKNGFRSAVMQAMKVCTEKTKGLGE